MILKHAVRMHLSDVLCQNWEFKCISCVGNEPLQVRLTDSTDRIDVR